MNWLLLKGSAALAVVASAFAAHAADFEVLSARQTTPGKVIVTVASPSAVPPKASDLALQLDNTPLIRADSVVSLATPAGPAWLVLCLDRSGSIGQPVLDGLKAGLNKALVEGRAANLPFKVAIIAFATQSKHVIDFTSDPAQVAAAIKPLTIDNTPAGRTKLHDAIASGLAALKAQGEGRKRLIVVSDGKDEGSTISAERLAELAQGPPRITIDALALGALAQDHSGAISSVAGFSGGRFLANADSKDSAQPLQRLIADAIRLSRFDVAFDYTPVADKRTTLFAALQYTPEGATQSRYVLQTALMAQNVEPSKAAASASPEEVQQRRRFEFSIEFIFNWLKNAPATLAWLAAALLAAALAMVYRHRRRSVLIHEQVEVGVIVSSQAPPPPPPPPPRRRSPTAVGHTWQQPATGRPVAILRGISGTARGQMISIDKALFRIGCDPDNDLVLIGDDFASGAHALMRFEAGALYVEDVGSTNGTFLNGGIFKSATRSLAPGDELSFGHTTFQVLAPQQAASGRSDLEPSPD